MFPVNIKKYFLFFKFAACDIICITGIKILQFLPTDDMLTEEEKSKHTEMMGHGEDSPWNTLIYLFLPNNIC